MTAKMPNVIKKKKNPTYTYRAPWAVYGLSSSYRQDVKNRLALGSFIEEYLNKVEIIQLNEEQNELIKVAEFDHPFPPTKIMWIPEKNARMPELLATSGDHLRLWEMEEYSVKSKCVLSNKINSDFAAPLTSFDWNEINPTMIGTASIDTTCTIWNIETQQARTQLIAHDKEVYDIAFARGQDIFASVGADGSLRVFDLRSLEHSTILYESTDCTPLLRLAWNKHDPNFLATFAADSTKLTILDVRVPSLPLTELQHHEAPINAFAWAPHDFSHICTVSDDSQALIWDLSQVRKSAKEPIFAWNAEAEINQVVWSPTQPNWVTVAFESCVQIMPV